VRGHEFECVPGETREVPVRLTNLSQAPLDLELELTSVIPTVKGRPVKAHLDAGAAADVALPVTVAESADWGRKTVTIELRWAGRTAYFVRTLVVCSLPDMRLSTMIEQQTRPQIWARGAANPWGKVAEARNVKLTVAGQVLNNGDAAPTPPQAIAEGAGAASLPPLRETAVTLDYDVSPRPGGTALRHITEQRTLALVSLPERLGQPVADAVPLLVSNPGRLPFGFGSVEYWLPRAGECGLYDDQGRPVLNQAVTKPYGGKDASARLLFPCVLPAGGAALYWLKGGSAANGPTDLACEVSGTPGSGAATVTVANSFYRITLAEAAGGTVTGLVSRRTGRDYGRHSFDTNLGRFSAAESDGVCYTTTALIREDKQYLSSMPATLKVERQGPVRVSVSAEGRVGGITCRTWYDFTAFSDAFALGRVVEFSGKERPEEIVVLDTDFAPNLLRKSYPGFAGILEEPPQPHFGWRYSDRVPELISLISADGTGEVISLLLAGQNGIDRVRQGFWPEKRPVPGSRDSARIEYVSRHAFGEYASVSVLLDVRLHSGHHRDAKQWLAARPLFHGLPHEAQQWFGEEQAVQVAMVRAETTPVAAAPAPPGDWWSAAWPVRLRFTAVEEHAEVGGRARVRLDLADAGTAGVAADSARLFEHHGGPLSERPCRLDAATGELVWAPDPQSDWPRAVDLYLRRPGQPALAQPDWGEAAIEPESVGAAAIERAHWELGGAEFAAEAGREGKPALVFANPGRIKAPLLATRRGFRVRPQTEYVVRFGAETADAGAVLSANIYFGPGYDFGQVHTPLTGDGQWHEYEIRVLSGLFPVDITPRLRFWTMPGRYRVAIDRVEVAPVGQPPAAIAAVAVPATVEVLPGEAR
jgi:hypothetical protein